MAEAGDSTRPCSDRSALGNSSLRNNVTLDSLSLIGRLGTTNNKTASTSSTIPSTQSAVPLTPECHESYFKFREEMLKQHQAAKSNSVADHSSHSPDRSGEECNTSGDSKAMGGIREEIEAVDAASSEIPDNDEVNDLNNQNPAREESCRSFFASRQIISRDEAFFERRRRQEALRRSMEARRATLKEDIARLEAILSKKRGT